ncbi:IS3 family transposase [Microbacterium excoecariae]|uniref:IS3 family transposase n=1 Tax=Microbacterium excoecariae TaxID=2715210 RepID=UPI00140861D7|nr:transposase [Microbacterium excoecariae]
MACRFLNVSTSGYYDWASRPPSPRAVADAELTTTIRRIHADSRATYGAPRVLAELRLGVGVHVGRKRVARLMRLGGSWASRTVGSDAGGSQTRPRTRTS